MRNRIVLSIALALVLLSPSIVAVTSFTTAPLAETSEQFIAAEGAYGDDVEGVHQAEDDDFAAAFPYYELYFVVEENGWGEVGHLLAWKPATVTGPGRAFDITTGYNALLSDAVAVIRSTSDALKYARAYAQTANAELQPQRIIATASDSSALGFAVASPTARSTGVLAYEVKLTTWSPENGVVANWTMTFASNTMRVAEWTVAYVKRGPYELAPDGIVFRPGHHVKVDFSSGSGSVGTGIKRPDGTIDRVGSVYMMETESSSSPQAASALSAPRTFIERPNPDGSLWRVLYPEAFGTLLPEQQTEIDAWIVAVADAAQGIYPTMVALNDPGLRDGAHACSGTPSGASSWGFRMMDADCVYEIDFTDPLALAKCGTAASTDEGQKLLLHPDIDVCLEIFRIRQEEESLYGATTPLPLAKMVVGHELFHLLQDGEGAGSGLADEMWREAMSVFVPTIIASEAESSTDSFWYMWMDSYLTKTNKGICWFNGVPADTSIATREARRLIDYQIGQSPVNGDPMRAYHAGNSGYQFGAFWGYLYSQAEKPWALFHRVLDELPTDGQDADCATNVERALVDNFHGDANLEGRTFEQLVRGYAKAVFDGTLTWNGTPWSPSDLDVSRETVAPAGTLEIEVGGWGIQFVEVDVDDASPRGLSCTYLGSTFATWSVTHHAVVDGQLGTATEITCQGDTVTAFPAAMDGDVIVVIRKSDSDGNLRIKLA